MTSISELSEDLIYYISLYFERDIYALHSLNLVSRKFHHATRALLFRHINCISAEPEALLSRSLHEVPELKTHIRSYFLCLNEGTLNHGRLREVLNYPHIEELSFTRFDKLRGGTGGFMDVLRPIMLRLREGRDSQRDFECAFLDDYALKQIRKVNLTGDFTTTELIRFVLLPNVTRMSATYLNIMKEPRLPIQYAHVKSTLTSLDILGGSLWRISASTMRTILSFCPHLRSLRCQVPMQTLLNSHTEQTCSVTEPVSPGELTEVFYPIRKTLQKLSLLNLRHRVPYDGSCMDLSCFSALEDLEFTSCCLLPPGPPCPKRDAISCLLPKSLRRLKLEFPRESGILYHHEEGEPFISQDPHNVSASRYGWILPLLQSKAELLPNLTEISMVDPPGSLNRCYWQSARWMLPDEIQEACEIGGLKLDVRISYPKPGSSSPTLASKGYINRAEAYAHSYEQ
ncbi:hypothetical protein FB567DRAFT_585103 [Paraphoma chrysanthemicola]|uniref:F-box domain-containing protein n=1 Tax=Paraphoma chrysanthemicola TaxID=798071 RepID=A0A8K0QUG7_9PLEO|nr:hypothetical protein FB567DRAFT_585103 [Paraphoma chrysanthemicola]